MSLKLQLQRGFALPTVVIASVVMLMVLVTAVGAVSSARVALDAQYDEQRLRDATESGAARAQDCMANSTMVLNIAVTPATNCDGSTVAGRSKFITSTPIFRTSYIVKLTDASARSKKVSIFGTSDTLRASDTKIVKSQALSFTQSATLANDPAGDRTVQRYWYFGNKVIMDFGVAGSAMPTASLNPSAVPNETFEGTTVVTDKDGNMVFWSDGLTIWDKSGQVMSGSTGLSGAPSATQAVASFPLNVERTKYGVVSNSGQAEDGFGYGELYLSVVDMSLNGGLGGVVPTQKNQKLGTATKYSGEGLSAMPKDDGSGYYVYTFNAVTSKITSFLIKNDGSVDGPFVTTFAPAAMKCRIITSGLSGYGSINFTKDFKRMIVMAGSFDCDGTNGGGPYDSGTAYLYNTNAANGSLSLQAAWTTSGLNGPLPGTSHSAYVADFSPGENYVYVAQIYPGMIVRYDLQNPTSAAIKASEWKIGYATTATDPSIIYQGGGHIRRGPDGRMWIADRAISSYPIRFQSAPESTPCKLSYISAPDSPTETAAGIGLKLDALTLTTNSCASFGLPQMATVFKPKIVLY